MSGTRARPTGPRRAPQPRVGSGRRATGSARGSRRAPVVGRPARDAPQSPAPEPDAEIEPAHPAGAAGAPRSDPRRRSGLALMLDELDRLLRDPTLTRALSAFATRLSSAARGLWASIAGAARRLPRMRLRLPRRLLLGLLALTLPFAVLALLSSSSDDRQPAGASDQAARSSAASVDGPSPSGAAMPRLAGAPDEVRPVSVALVLDETYDGAKRTRELRALGDWLAANHAPGTRVSVIDAATGRASRALRAEGLADARFTRAPASTAAAVRSAFAGSGRRRRLLVTLGAAPPAGGARTLRIRTRRGAARDGELATSGKRSRATIDDGRPDALAASVARRIMSISGQSELRNPPAG